jgi:Exonuclease V - a 5' deoxyribonuclease
VFGHVKGHLVNGVIDQIADVPLVIEEGPLDNFVNIERKQNLVISDVKTRVTATLPNFRQSRSSEVQLGVYYMLLSNMIDGLLDVNRVFSELELKPHVVFSDPFLMEAGEVYTVAGVLTFDSLLEHNTLDVCF